MDWAGTLHYTVEWIHPDRPLTFEVVAALRMGYLSGDDLRHIAVALYLNESVSGTLAFITLYRHQQAAVASLGLPT